MATAATPPPSTPMSTQDTAQAEMIHAKREEMLTAAATATMGTELSPALEPMWGKDFAEELIRGTGVVNALKMLLRETPNKLPETLDAFSVVKAVRHCETADGGTIAYGVILVADTNLALAMVAANTLVRSVV